MAKAYIRADSPNVWITFSHKKKRYRRKTKYSVSDENLALVQAQLPEFMRKVKSGEISLCETDSQLFDYYIDLWIKSKKHLKETTKKGYEVSYRYWLSHFKGKAVKDIKASQIKTILLNSDNGKGTKRNKLKCLKQIFQEAYIDDAIKDNPCNKVKLSFNDNEDSEIIDPFTVEEVETLLESSTGYFKCYLAIAFYTGARTGEIFAMKWYNIDFNRKRIFIDATVGEYEENSPKTKSGIRYVPIFDNLMPYLREYQKLTGLREYLFLTNRGKTYTPSNVRTTKWKPLLRECGFSYRKLYQTRHTFATTMIMSNKFNLNQIAKIMGHATIQTLMLDYNKFIEGAKEMEIDTNFALFDTKNVTKKILGA